MLIKKIEKLIRDHQNKHILVKPKELAYEINRLIISELKKIAAGFQNLKIEDKTKDKEK